jgi:N-acetylglucosaminyldiphosphoundecaprenol N-acetyl-beta-D-mannosaminyltransferase
LEWLFRLLMDPRRLWRRYFKNNPRFLWLIAWQLLAGTDSRGVN